MGVIWGFLMLALLVLGPSSSDPVRPPEIAAVPERTQQAREAHPPKVAKAPAPAAAADSPKIAPREGSDPLAGRRLLVPVEGVHPSRLRDTFDDGRGPGRRHQAIDIMAPRGTPVLAADDGRVAKISSNRGGGLSAYLVDPSGQLVYYYAHLDGYAPGLREGQAVKQGDLIGYVGSTGNAPESAPHLHFAVLLLASEKRWWGGEALNPYAALVGGEAVASSATAEQRAGRPTR